MPRSSGPTAYPPQAPAGMLGSAWEWLVGVLAATSDCQVAEALRKEALREGREQKGGAGSSRDGSHRDMDDTSSRSSSSASASSSAEAEAEAEAEAARWLASRWAQAGAGGPAGLRAEERAIQSMVECMLAEDEDTDEEAFLDSLLMLPMAEDAASVAEEWEDTESTSSVSTSASSTSTSSSAFSTLSALSALSTGSAVTVSSEDSTPPPTRAKQGRAGGPAAQGKRRGQLLWGEPSKQRQVEEPQAQLPLTAWQSIGLAAAAAFRLSPSSQEASLPPPPPLEREDSETVPEDPIEAVEPAQATTPALTNDPTALTPSNESNGSKGSKGEGGGPPPSGGSPPKRTRSVRQLLDAVVCQTSKDQELERASATSSAGPATSAAAEAPGCARWQGAPATAAQERPPARSSPKSVFEGYWAKEEDWLLPPKAAEFRGKRTLVLDLDETLIHSVFQPCAGADFTLQVQLEQGLLDVYVLKRPGVDEFLRRMAQHYEIVVFTASVREYADPLLDELDPHGVVSHRLFRDSCTSARCGYVKDLARLGRPLGDTIIVDNSPHAYAFHPDNALPILSFYDDRGDCELRKVSPFLESLGGIQGDARQLLTAALGADVKSLLHTRLSYIL